MPFSREAVDSLDLLIHLTDVSRYSHVEILVYVAVSNLIYMTAEEIENAAENSLSNRFRSGGTGTVQK